MNKSHRKLLVILSVVFGFSSFIQAQEVALKTNTLYWGTTSPNIGMEVALGRKITLDVSGGINLFTFSNNKKLKHGLLQPELRFWTCEAFNGHFFGIHAHGAQFNVGGWNIPVGRLSVFKDHRYEGWLAGGGLTYGYQWVLSKHWNFEASIGAGYAYIDYRKYNCPECGQKVGEGKINYFGVTKAALSLIYVLK